MVVSMALDVFEGLREIYRLDWRDKPDDELLAELKRISEISQREPIHITHPALAEKFLVLGEIMKQRRGVEPAKKPE
jgi:hypothetical protein